MRPVPLRRAQAATLGLGLATSLFAWAICCPWNIRWWCIGAPLGRDFVNFWMAPRLAMAGQERMLIDLPAYRAAIGAAFALPTDPLLLFVYPPHILPLLVPFAVLPFLPAVLAWTLLNLAALAGATRLLLPRLRARPLLLVCLSPPALIMVLYGHFGGLLALASTVAVFQSERRPWLAGLCLAFLTVKPQYAAALWLILLFGGRWRCLSAAGVATAMLVALSVAAFGLEPWTNFLTVTMPLQSAIISDFRAEMINSAISAYFTARIWGVPGAAAWTLQCAVSVAALAAGVRALRRPAWDASGLFVVLLSALVMQPYASHYDLAIVAPALTLVLLARAPRASPLVSTVWVLMPLARILFVFGVPVLGVLVPAALLVQAARLVGVPEPSRPEPGDGRLSPAT